MKILVFDVFSLLNVWACCTMVATLEHALKYPFWSQSVWLRNLCSYEIVMEVFLLPEGRQGGLREACGKILVLA